MNHPFWGTTIYGKTMKNPLPCTEIRATGRRPCFIRPWRTSSTSWNGKSHLPGATARWVSRKQPWWISVCQIAMIILGIWGIPEMGNPPKSPKRFGLSWNIPFKRDDLGVPPISGNHLLEMSEMSSRCQVHLASGIYWCHHWQVRPSVQPVRRWWIISLAHSFFTDIVCPTLLRSYSCWW